MKIEIKLQPFTTPNFVIAQVPPQPREHGFAQAPSFPLSEVDADSLSVMCDEFRAEVFKKAGKRDPRAPTE